MSPEGKGPYPPRRRGDGAGIDEHTAQRWRLRGTGPRTDGWTAVLVAIVALIGGVGTGWVVDDVSPTVAAMPVTVPTPEPSPTRVQVAGPSTDSARDTTRESMAAGRVIALATALGPVAEHAGVELPAAMSVIEALYNPATEPEVGGDGDAVEVEHQAGAQGDDVEEPASDVAAAAAELNAARDALAARRTDDAVEHVARAEYLAAGLLSSVAATDQRPRGLDLLADRASDAGNGQLPGDVLCTLPWAQAHQVRCDALTDLIALDAAYREEFGSHLAVTDSYRSLAEQVHTKSEKADLAATPGRSQHGWGLALDLGGGIQDAGSAQHAWMDQNAPDFGWVNPAWARENGTKFEPWHFEYSPPQPTGN